jgi:hypothetical protein
MSEDEAKLKETEDFIRATFERNFETLRYESGGHSLTTDVREAALNQVLLYWRKLHGIAEKVTDTEVKLNLPAQQTPAGRTFGIEGVVDIVREHGQTTMYDIKTHDVEYVRSNKELYERQLNVYAHIWQNLRGQELDYTAIIATNYPDGIREALESGDERRLAYEVGRWDPVVKLDFHPDRVQQTIDDFAATVDAIEDGIFCPPDQAKLMAVMEGTTTRFATRVCRNCDARFSCDAYRRYALGSSGGRVEEKFRRYYNDYGSDLSQEHWKTSNLADAVTAGAEDLI